MAYNIGPFQNLVGVHWADSDEPFVGEIRFKVQVLVSVNIGGSGYPGPDPHNSYLLVQAGSQINTQIWGTPWYDPGGPPRWYSFNTFSATPSGGNLSGGQHLVDLGENGWNATPYWQLEQTNGIGPFIGDTFDGTKLGTSLSKVTYSFGSTTKTFERIEVVDLAVIGFSWAAFGETYTPFGYQTFAEAYPELRVVRL